MSIRNSSSRYGSVSIVVHWLMALLIISMIVLGLLLDDFDKSIQGQMVNLHKATGFMVLCIALFRWFWVLTNKQVQALPNWSKAEVGLSHAIKWSLLLMMLIMPLSGWFLSMYAGHGINFYGLVDIPSFLPKHKPTAKIFGSIHEIGGYTIITLIVIHLLGVFKHHVIKKDSTLKRMLGKAE